MDKQKNSQKITAIVPTWNEAPRIKKVLDVLVTYPNFKEVIVIDDGSTDNTEQIVKQYNVRYIKNETNRGKGFSMDRAVQEAATEIIFFCDADVSGITHHVIDQITRPVLERKVDMFIGMRNRKIYFVHAVMAIVPLVGGERALTKTLWEKIPNYYKHYFRIEAGLNFYAKYYGDGFDYKVFKGMSQVIKEKKYGFLRGTQQRFQLYSDLILAQLKLRLVDIPKSIQNKRKILRFVLQSFAGMVLGAVCLVAAKVGPRTFIYKIFYKELVEDPEAPFVHFLLRMAGTVSSDILIVIGFLLVVANVIIFVPNVKKLYKIMRK